MLNKRTWSGLSVAVLLAWGANLFGAGSDMRLADAAMQGDRDLMRALVAQKADVNAAQGDGTTALHWAAYKDDLESAQLLIRHGAKVNATTRIGALTPLLMAARTGDAKMIEMLVAAGADVNQTNGEGTTALMMAAASGSADAVKTLLDHGAEVNAKESAHGQTAAMFAAALNRDAALKVLAGRGADLSVTTKVTTLARIKVEADGSTTTLDNKKTPAKAAAAVSEAGDEEAVTGNPPPPSAGRGADGKEVTTRLAAGRELGTSIMGGMTALLFAARDGQTTAARVLVESGANINEPSASDQTTPLVMAILNGHFDLAKYFLEHGADVNAANAAGLAPLYATVDVQWAPHSWYPQPDTSQEKTTYLQLMQLLVDRGANINAKLGKKLWYRGLAQDGDWIDASGSTAFWRAAKADDLPAMRYLIAHGADPNLASTQGDTPLMVAAGMGWEGNYTANVIESWLDAVKYCVELGADVNAADARGYTALHGTAYVGRDDIIKYLASKGARLNAITKAGDSIADMANGPQEKSLVHPETVALLEQLGSPNSHNCRSSECVVPTKADKKPGAPSGLKGSPASAPPQK